MKMRLKYIFLIVLLQSVGVVCFSQSSQANERNWQRGDSVERIKMKDSLGVDDATVTKVFSVRDSIMTKIITIRGENKLSFQQQDELVNNLRRELNEQIRLALGDEIYRRYLQMIRNSLQQRNKKSLLPLAGEKDY